MHFANKESLPHMVQETPHGLKCAYCSASLSTFIFFFMAVM